MSYAHFDDEHDRGYLTKLSQNLSDEISAQTGNKFEIFQDRKDIRWGEEWKSRIYNTLGEVTFFIPVITPSFFNSNECRKELKYFLNYEKKLGRNDLILPIYYIETPKITDKSIRSEDELANIISERQYEDWKELRHESINSRKTRIAITKLSRHICSGIDKKPLKQNLKKSIYDGPVKSLFCKIS